MQKPSAEQSANQIVGVMHKIAQSENPLGVQIGLVLKEPPDLEIGVNNIILTKKDLYVDFFLCQGYQREYSGTTEMTNVKGDVKMDDFEGNVTYRYGGLDF